MKKIFNYLWVVPIITMGLTLPYKFTFNAAPYLVEFFDNLIGYGDYAMFAIGLQELALIIGLLIPKTRIYATAGTILTMVGAIITHYITGVFDIVFVQAIITLAASWYYFKQKA